MELTRCIFPKGRYKMYLLIFVLACLLITGIILGFQNDISSFEIKHLQISQNTMRIIMADQESHLKPDNPEWGPHKLCILVPFRDCFDELEKFVPYMHSYLNNKTIRHKIMVLNQHDMLRFNRASLINVGFIITVGEKECDYIAMHDVDLLPLNPQLNYSYPEKGPFHVAQLHPMYHYEKFIGGVLLLTNEHFKKTRGLSNIFWGHGGEDDQFYIRISSASLKIIRSENMSTNYSNTFKHLHGKSRQRDRNDYSKPEKLSSKRDYKTGVDTVQYELLSKKEVTISGYKCFVYNIQLYCDLNSTPWCVHPDQLQRLINNKEISHDTNNVITLTALNELGFYNATK